MLIWQLLLTTCFSARGPTWLPQHHIDSTEPASMQWFTHNRFPYKPQRSPFCHCSVSLLAVGLRSLKEDVPKQLFSKAVQISVSLSISNRSICFLFQENHWHCVSVSNQPHMPFCKNSSLIITVPSFFFASLQEENMELPLAVHLGKRAAAIASWSGICVWEIENGGTFLPAF